MTEALSIVLRVFAVGRHSFKANKIAPQFYFNKSISNLNLIVPNHRLTVVVDTYASANNHLVQNSVGNT